MDNKTPATLLTLALAATLFLSGCQPHIPASLPDDQVVQVVDNILTAFQSGDFAAATRDMSDDMKKDFNDTKFANMADMLRQTYGNYISCDGALMTLSNNQGYAVYPCRAASTRGR